MLTRCLMQSSIHSLRTTVRFSKPCPILCNRSMTRTILIVKDNLKNHLIKDRKLTTNQTLFNKDKPMDFDKFKQKFDAKLVDSYKKFEAREFGPKLLLELEQELAQLSLIQKFKKIVSEFYHIIIIVHTITSTLWFTTMYLIKLQFGLTPKPLIKFLEPYDNYIPEFFLQPLKNPYFQEIAVPFFMYKFVTPLRYYSTIAITMATIRRLLPKGKIMARQPPKIIQMLYGKLKKKGTDQ